MIYPLPQCLWLSNLTHNGTKLFNHVVTWDHVMIEKPISTTTKRVGNKPGRVIMLSCKIAWQIKYLIFSLPEWLRPHGYIQWLHTNIATYNCYPVDTGWKLNVHKTFRRRPGYLLNVSCTFNLCPVSTGYIQSWASF